MDRGLVARGRSAGVAGGERETVSASRPAPPEGHASWLDYVLNPSLVTVQRRAEHARAELAELRKELADTKAQLALQSANTVEAMQQRNAAQAERDALRMTRARGCQCGDADVCAVIHEMSIERDSLRAQVAELRGAVLGLGELDGTEVHVGYGPMMRCHLDVETAAAFNALVARLRAEALPGAGEPAAGEQAREVNP